MHRRIGWVGIVSVAAAAFVMGDADAEPVQQPSLYTDGRGAPPAYSLPAAPALAAGCTAPTKEQCTDSNWYKTDACAKDPAKAKGMQDYCTWVLQKAWVDTQTTQRARLFPTSPPSSVYPILSPGRLDQHGKGVTAGQLNRPAEKRRFAGRAPRNQSWTPASPPKSLDWTPSKMTAGGGSFAGIHTASIVPQLAGVSRQVAPFRQAGVADATLRPNVAALTQTLSQRPSFVTPGAGVSSCEEYAYKRWGEWSDFAHAAKKLGTNYRQVYKNATDPSSSFFINKSVLKQTGIDTRIPIQIYQQVHNDYWFGDYTLTGHDSVGDDVSDAHVYPWISDGAKYWSANAFLAHPAPWLSDPKATTQHGKVLITDAEKAQITALINASWNGLYNQPRVVRAKNDNSPLAVHVEMKKLFDTKYGDPLDDEMADIEKRTATYMNLLGKSDGLRVEMICDNAGDPCFRCSQPPGSGATAALPGALQKLKDKLTGAPVINPGDITALLQSGSMATRQRALTAMSRIGGAYADLYAAPRAAMPSGTAVGGGAKQKGAPVVAQLQQPGGVTVNDPVTQCKQALGAKGAAAEAAYYENAEQLIKVLVNELKFGDRGCLANPGTDIGNLCDWSYAKFASFASTLFDKNVEHDFQQCRSEINTATAAVTPKPAGNSFTAILKDPRNQALAFPCTQRRDFTDNAMSADWFFRLSGNSLGRYCEAARQNDSIADQQSAIVDQLSGIRFKNGEVFESTADNNTLGDLSSLGAYFDYDASWSMKRTAAYAGGDPMKTCRYDAAGVMNLKTGIYFFGDNVELFQLNSHGESNGTGKASTVSMNARYLDIDTFKETPMVPKVKDQPVPAGQDYAIPLVNPPYNLGGIEYGFWFSIGPIPIHIKFGATATAGLDYNFAAQTGDNCNVPWPNGAPSKGSGYKMVSNVDPYIEADAYADASVDIVVASAGVRLDLELLRLGMPIGVNVRAEGMSFDFNNGMDVTIDMLSGKLEAYVEVGLGPFSVEEDVTIFSWDGFHTDIPLWGLHKTLPEGVIRVAMANYVDPGNVKCSCDQTKCCSNVGCGQQTAACMATTKQVNGEPKVCTFTAADFQEMWTTKNAKVASMRTTEMLQCQWFIK